MPVRVSVTYPRSQSGFFSAAHSMSPRITSVCGGEA